MTLRDLARTILSESLLPLTARQVWDEAVKRGLDKQVATKGKTPDATVGAYLYTESKKPGSGIVATGTNPAQFSLSDSHRKEGVGEPPFVVQEPSINSLPIKERLYEFIESFQPTQDSIRKRQLALRQRAAFVQKFPLSSLLTLSPKQYCIGAGDNKSLCWWAERGTKAFCSYFPGSSRSYGMYYGKNENKFLCIKSLQLYRASHPTSSDSEVLQETILRPLHGWIENKGNRPTIDTVGRGFALKLLLLYYPDEFIHITSVAWLDKILSSLGLPIHDNPSRNSRTLKAFYDETKDKFPNVDFEQQDFIAFFVDELGLKSKTERTDPSSSEERSPMYCPLNTILYGPPGTGKTYSVAIRAVAILENKSIEDVADEPYDEVHKRFLDYIERRRVDFTTFHQSYGYEDFIEGIRPILDEEREAIGYERHDGVFKAFCDAARRPTAGSTADYGLNDTPTIWKVSLGGTGSNPTREDCLKNGYIRIGWDEYGEDLSPEALEKMTDGRFILKSFAEEMSVGDIVLSCWSNREIDAIGVVTGEYEWRDQFSYYRRLRKVRWIVKGIRENILDLNGGKTLTLSTVYKLNRMQVSDVLAIVTKHTNRNATPSAPKDGDPYVFVIDEINRGNISKIFGELITLIEPSKRLGAEEETKVSLPYSGVKFGVPPNVYILGTMNTADRSIALLDTALRRRFEFVEMMPRPELLRDVHVAGEDGKDSSIDLEKMLTTMNDRIEFLLDREHTIGHAYFMGDFNNHPTLDSLSEIFRNRIIPLLQEYFFDDYSKIRLVLGDNAKTDESTQFFVEKGPAGVFFGNVEDTVDADQRICRLNDAAFTNPASYIAIYQSPAVPPSGDSVA